MSTDTMRAAIRAALGQAEINLADADVDRMVDAVALPEHTHPFPGNVLVHVQGMGLEGSDEDGPDQADREIRTVTEDLDHAMLITSDTGRTARLLERAEDRKGFTTREHALHRPVLDLDVPCTLVESSTPGHYHLMIDHTMTWERYSALLVALAEAGLVENGYERAAARRGSTGVRVPWFRKGDTPPPPPPGAELLPTASEILDDAPPWSVA